MKLSVSALRIDPTWEEQRKNSYPDPLFFSGEYLTFLVIPAIRLRVEKGLLYATLSTTNGIGFGRLGAKR